jgi:hypothetical protein
MSETIKFRPQINTTYPPFNFELFEEFFFKKFIHNEEHSRIYIPIFWTSLYVNRNYGQNDLSDIQFYLDNLDRSKKYFTIVQYDDNILNDLSDLDIRIFTMGGFGKYEDRSYPIPLNCIPPPNLNKEYTKDIFASFIGSMTHGIRKRMIDILSQNEKYIVSNSLSYQQFRETMSRSLFSLCPRGYGQTSFRICESLQVGSIPVYIYDQPLIPFNDILDFNDYGLLIHESKISQIDSILSSIPLSKVESLRENGETVYKNYYSYEGCYNKILQLI